MILKLRHFRCEKWDWHLPVLSDILFNRPSRVTLKHASYSPSWLQKYWCYSYPRVLPTDHESCWLLLLGWYHIKHVIKLTKIGSEQVSWPENGRQGFAFRRQWNLCASVCAFFRLIVMSLRESHVWMTFLENKCSHDFQFPGPLWYLQLYTPRLEPI